MALTDTTTPSPTKQPKAALIIGLVLMLVLGGAGFLAAYKGLLSFRLPTGSGSAPVEAFIPLDSLVISIGSDVSHHLRFSAQLAVPRPEVKRVEALKPRIQDVLNSYLRALDPEEIADPGALIRLRAQILRRVRLITGDQMVNDLLISEFVLS